MSFLKKFTRVKKFEHEGESKGQLKKCLTTSDLTWLGVGSTLGSGVYVLTGQVASVTSGPSIIISFLIAAVSSIMAGLCYAEFGARVPKAGSAYIYSYVTLGELWAFVIGWNLVLEYVIGAASVARAWSSNFDAIFGNVISSWMSNIPWPSISGIAAYPDVLAFLVVLGLTAVLIIGAKESAVVTKVLTWVNVTVILFVIVAGMYHADLKNWNLNQTNIDDYVQNDLKCNLTARKQFLERYGNETKSAVASAHGSGPDKKDNCKEDFGSGGFFPYGFDGIIKGAAICFYGYVGFDIIASTGEEAKNPQRSVPRSITFSLLIVCLAYFGISVALTLMQPYFKLDNKATMPVAFENVGWKWAKYLTSVGGTAALTSSLLGAIFPLPRIVWAMASDGLLFSPLAQVNERFKTPVVATISSGLFAGIMVLLFDLEALVDMMSIGTLLAYSLVAACVLILRYQCIEVNISENKSFFKSLLSPGPTPTKRSGDIVYRATLIFFVVSFGFGWFKAKVDSGMVQFAGMIICAALAVCIMFLIWLQPTNDKKYSFMVPCLPWLPLVSCFFNIYLMCELNWMTWIRFSVWMIVGFFIYFFYGISHSTATINSHKSEEKMRLRELEEQLK